MLSSVYKTRHIFVIIATMLLSSCALVNNCENSFLEKQASGKQVYTCEWIDKIDSIDDIQKEIGKHISYKLGGKRESMQSPEETCNLGTGNCADMSILMIDILYIRFGIKSNLVAVNSNDCRSVVNGGLDIDHAIVENGEIYYEATAKRYYTYTDVSVCYRYTFDELFGN